ncbi:MAG: class I SAM-dependent methyltransferase [Chloroflexi bacterium]|nr:class I SAM-dependent methyltransferase [Chloroflexota bacterium]
MSEKERADWVRRWAEGDYPAREEPSSLLVAWAKRLPRGRALEIACGNGRNALYLAGLGFTVDAVDIAAPALKLARQAARKRRLAVKFIEADLDEHPLPAEAYDLITTSFFINRNLVPRLKDALKPGGFVIHEHHYLTDVDVGGPTDRGWRMRPNELLHLFLDFRVRSFWEGLEHERGRLIAIERLVAQKPPASWEPPAEGPGDSQG